jgi:hypothetical protein
VGCHGPPVLKIERIRLNRAIQKRSAPLRLALDGLCARLYLPADAFANQMRYLAAHHFHAVTPQAVWAYWENGATLPIHPIVLSFDDGYRSQFTNAARTSAGITGRASST